ncbi:Hypp6922 [Branchiostoma lanceolatum]|uniref:Hypp6922 protein n=1 Tax=Branchiostoma lanceolatum TaxID=7740 RepID=A0A8K0EBB4_BRALA|nr:Hypp6922 [Branchiostoma lanceolatum]
MGTGVQNKRSGRVSMATMMLFIGVAVVLILVQPTAAEPRERSLLAIMEDTDHELEDGQEFEEIEGETEWAGGEVRVGRSLLWIWGGRARCPCVRYCSRTRCSGWWFRRRCHVTSRYCCQRKCSFGVY